MAGRKRTAAEKNRKKGRSKLYIIEAVVVFVFVIGLSAYAMTGSLKKQVNESKAVRIAGEVYSVSDVNYFFYTYYNSYREEYADYIDYMIDESKSLKEQEYEEGVSWFDFLLDESIQSMASILLTAQEAGKEGFVLSDDAKKQIQEYLDTATVVAETANVTADQYVAGIYGSGMTMERYEELMNMSFLANEYADAKKASYTYSDEQIRQYCDEHSKDYMYVDYERVYVKACESTEDPTDEQMRQAKETAGEILARAEAGEDLRQLAEAADAAVYYSLEDAYYSEGYSYGEWLFSEDRQDGDMTVIEDEKGYYVMLFHSSQKKEYLTVDIRDILFGIESDELDESESDYSTRLDALYEQSCEDAEDVYSEWTAGGATEELFASLADQYTASADPEGGLYEGLMKDTLDTAIDNWCFDESRQPGDCTILYTEEGFHLVYFVQAGEPAWMKEVENDLRDTDFQEWYENVVGSAEIQRYDKALDGVAGSLT